MQASEIEAMFTRGTGDYVFARWERPIVPVVFGVDDATLTVVKGAVEAVVALADHKMAETDPELGANLMFFFFSDWAELRAVPRLGEMIPDLDALTHRLEAAGANQYRAFRFEANGAIKAAFVFLRMDDELSALPAEVLALNQAVQVVLLWSDKAFTARSPLARAGEAVVLRPDVGDLIRAGYDRVMPVAAGDPSHALRLAARLAVNGGAGA
ncbi:hypothetical protein EOK75_05010 [Pseudorhodobacter turbinis]|uniref:Uncharacterized protein n=1 Tax=Pseudorhodobacter turbinis TaxID=2500533 RepID=A0A4P8EHZ0_9RHOB|nr:hypothetical protein [Pseudorhodobacter turbinis]QCO56519.1 hypothetical protein EOK75_05010 [Pseudorhodobacter turbinis]